MKKYCSKCKKESASTTDYFYKDKSRKDGLCKWCKECGNKYNLGLKLQVIEHYGGCYNWPGCEIEEPAFLATDHINNDGAKHRKEAGSGRSIHLWLIHNNFPSGIQILCHNHNHLKQLEFNKTKWKQTKKAIEARKWSCKLRLLIVSHYGGRCACCGESNIDLLTIDHIYGSGTKHVKGLGGWKNFYRWLKHNNFPSGYQVLCHNCNDGRHINGGVCLHK